MAVDENQRPVPLLNATDGVRADTGVPPCRLEEECLTMDAMVR